MKFQNISEQTKPRLPLIRNSSVRGARGKENPQGRLHNNSTPSRSNY